MSINENGVILPDSLSSTFFTLTWIGLIEFVLNLDTNLIGEIRIENKFCTHLEMFPLVHHLFWIFFGQVQSLEKSD